MRAALSQHKAFAIWFKDLEQWDFLSLWLRKTVRVTVPLVKIGDVFRVRHEIVLAKSSTVRKISMLDKVSFSGEIFAGERQQTRMTQYLALPDDIVVSKIRARQGSVGLVSETDGPISITVHYRALVPNKERVLPHYAWLAMRTEYARAQFLSATGGAMKGEISEEALLKILIPLPPLPVQAKIVTLWRKAQGEADESRNTIAKLVANIQIDMYKILGMKPPRTDIGVPKVFGVWWKNIERWSLSFNQQAIHRPDPKSGRYPTATLGSLIQDLENGWSPKCHNRPATSAEWGVLKLGAVSFGTFDPHENKALPTALKPRLHLEVKIGEVLITRANITRLVGACAVVSETRPRLLLCDKIFRVIFKPDSRILSGYLTEIMKTPHLRHQIENAVTGTSPTMKNITKTSLLRLLLPLPPLDTQHKLVDTLKDQRMRIAEERKAAEVRRAQAARNVEAMILGVL